MKLKKSMILIGLASTFLIGCEYEETEVQKDTKVTMEIANELIKNQPTPTDIEYSLERYNLIKRTYWVNGQREKALSLPSPVERPLGYVVLLTEGGTPVGNFVVDGKVTSLNSFLTPDSEYYEKDLGYRSGGDLDHGAAYKYSNKWLADVDGSFGENDNGIFFFTTDGKYIEWSGIYLYSDIPFEIENPVLQIKGD